MPPKTTIRPTAETPHYHGHRERLRERFHSAGAGRAERLRTAGNGAVHAPSPGATSSRWPKSLIKKFGSFAEVVHAPETRLREVDGIGEAAITELKLIAAAASRIAKGQLEAAHRCCRHGTT